MKHKTITTGVCELFVCEVPEDSHVSQISIGSGIVETAIGHPNGAYKPLQLPEGNWQLIGRFPDTTDKQWGDIVDKMVFIDEDGEFEDVVKYRSYSEIPITPFGKTYSPITSSQSGHSLLQANGVYFENPLGASYKRMPEAGMDYRSFLRWHKAQEQVWDKERTFLFKKVG